MTDEPSNPADPACWLARGRQADHAAAIAAAWRDYPDLPPDAALEARMARTRTRVAAMRPVHEAIRVETERARMAANFAFAQAQCALGLGGDRYAAILRARDRHGLGWDEAVAYADGDHAAPAGWEYRPLIWRAEGEARMRAYDLGFGDGGGRPDDLFDTARRAYAAQSIVPRWTAHDNLARRGRPLPSEWPSPTDGPRPVRWRSRLLILGNRSDDPVTAMLRAELSLFPGHVDACVITVDAQSGFARFPAGGDDLRLPLAALLEGAEFEDALVAAGGDDLARIDAEADAIPLSRTMERTRNSAIQQRSQFRLWLARGLDGDDMRGAGHIRWGKVARGLTGRLGEFTARYGGPAKPRGHIILIELPDGRPATGFATVRGNALAPEQVISNRHHLRREMTVMLRAFAAAIPQF